MNRKLFSIGLACFIALFLIPHFAHAQDSGPMVHLVYFRASDTAPRPDVDAEINELIKKVQLFFADEMERHGYGRKTFQIESDARGNTIVHHVVGKFTYAHYRKTGGWSVETAEQINLPEWRFNEQINLPEGMPEWGFIVYMVETHGEDKFPICGLGGGYSFGGAADIFCWNWQVIAHELGHAFGLSHDFRSDTYIMSYGLSPHQFSQCATEWLDAHSAFNPNLPAVVDPAGGGTVEMLPPSLAAPPNAIRLRFRVTNPNGLHQVQLLTIIPGGTYGSLRLLGCKALNGSTGATVEFATTGLTPKSSSVTLRGIDVHGNFIRPWRFPINITPLLPRAKIVSIPDANLAAAVQREIGNITTHSMLNLQVLNTSDSGITNLTGLEHAHNLRNLFLTGNNISDISALSELTNLTFLVLGNNNISDISALTEITQLTRLELFNNSISDISPLAGMTHLDWLYLGGNSISDISPLANLTNLTHLYLGGNSISDFSLLAGLTHLRNLGLVDNGISDVSSFAGIPQLKTLSLDFNNITDISSLIEMEHLTYLSLDWNPLSYTAINTHIPAMQEQGIQVSFTNRIPTRLIKISGDTQQALTNTELPLPFVVEVQDQRYQVFTEVPVTFTITDGDGKLGTTKTKTDAKGRAQTRLTLGETSGTTTVQVTAPKITQSIYFTATAIPPDLPVSLPDDNLYAKIEESLGKPSGVTLTVEDMLTLTSLTANNANISDLTGLEYATNLTTLSLDNNNLTNVTLFLELTQLKTLSLENNNLSDVAPLAQLTQLITLDLTGNLLNYPSLYTHIPAIQSRGTVVTYDNRIPTTIHNVSSTHGISNSTVAVFIEIKDENGLLFSGVPVNFTLTTPNGQRSTTRGFTNINGRTYTILTLGPTPGKNTIHATVAEISEPFRFTITGINANTVVHFPDVNLQAKIAETLKKPSGEQITAEDMFKLTRLDAQNANIENLTGLEHAYNLKFLNLGALYIDGKGWTNNNKITDFSPLEQLPLLYTLVLYHSSLSDISALTGLTYLFYLDLRGNAISDISPLAGMTQLAYLNLTNNEISDVSPIAKLTHLKNLYLSANKVLELNLLSQLTQLEYIGLSNNTISDISPLAGMIQLKSLNLGYNNISDVTSLTQMKNLETLFLHNNNISDISPLVELNLTGTKWNNTGLYLKGNPLNNESIRTHIPAMQARGIVISFDNITHPEFLIISGDKQEELVGRTLPSPFVVEYRDANGKPEEEVKVTFSIADGDAELTDTNVTTDGDGRAQTFLRFGWKLGTITINVTAEGINSLLTFTASVVLPENHVSEDVNADGIVDVEDLVLVAATIGTTPPDGTIPNTDVNGDGVVNSDDLALVMAALETTPAAPAAVLTAENLQRWIDEAKQFTNIDATFLRGIEVLEQMLETLLPKKTALLANYPNPFNPETWIPYHLAKPAAVTLHIYAVNGTLIRTLSFGHKAAGIYEYRNSAAYWDGKNTQGERVASGIYFYTLTAGDFTSTRKMLIQK